MRLHSLVHGQLLGKIIVEISAVPQARISRDCIPFRLQARLINFTVEDVIARVQLAIPV